MSYLRKTVPLFLELPVSPPVKESGAVSWPRMCVFRLFWTAGSRPDRTYLHENGKNPCFCPPPDPPSGNLFCNWRTCMDDPFVAVTEEGDSRFFLKTFRIFSGFCKKKLFSGPGSRNVCPRFVNACPFASASSGLPTKPKMEPPAIN